ncbi:UNVERIFIED_CONTAM: hypothetical protein Slati_4290800 [Sesamum latifolium]|uniref:DUF4283 domain-containing protein n=1 Tax=Sesamum latifolium TaxID=2727402 RepID=A0AAW2TCZ5_9LAMI
MEEDILKMGTSLTVEEEVVLDSGLWKQGGFQSDLVLVGSLLSQCTWSFNALKMTLSNLIRPTKGMIVQRAETDRFYLVFNHPVDVKCTLELGPWTFDRNLMILQPLSSLGSPWDIYLNWCSFFVHVHNLPYKMRGEEVIRDVN